MAKQVQDARQVAPSLARSRKISPRRPVLVLAGAEEHLVAADPRLLGVPVATVPGAGSGAAYALVVGLCR